MRIHILVVLMSAFSSTSFAACYTVYDKSDKPVYKSSEPPFDLSIPISEGIKSKYPGGYLVQTNDRWSCYLPSKKSEEAVKNRRIQLQAQGFSEVNDRLGVMSFPKETVVSRPQNTPQTPPALNINGGSASISRIVPQWNLQIPSAFLTQTEQAEQETRSKLEEVSQQLQRAEIEREFDKKEQERAVNEAAETARQEAEERAKKAIEEAEQAAEELRAEMTRSAIMTKNNFYLGGLLLAICGFFTYFITRFKKGKIMGDEQKYGVAVMIISFLLMLLSVIISSCGSGPFGSYCYKSDFLTNLLDYLYIDLICVGVVACETLSVTISTKYAVFIFMSTAAYGLATYLDITPAFRPWKNLLHSLKH